MASNPQFRPKTPPRGPHAVPDLPIENGRQFPWPLVGVISAAILLGVLIFWLPRMHVVPPSPAGAQIPSQPVPSQIELSGFKMSAAPVGSAYYLDGLLFNHGTTEITGLQMKVSFMGPGGKVVGSELRPVGEVSGPSDMRAQNLVQNPIKPRETRPVRIYIDHPPANWNHEMPELSVSEVTGTTTQK